MNDTGCPVPHASRDSVSVNVEDADMTNQDLGRPEPRPGQGSRRDRATRAIRNSGTTRVELVAFELK